MSFDPARFAERLHPRDRRGRFILKGPHALVPKDRSGHPRRDLARHVAARVLGVEPLAVQLQPLAPASPGRPGSPTMFPDSPFGPPPPPDSKSRLERLRDALRELRDEARKYGVSTTVAGRAYIAVVRLHSWFDRQAEYFNPVTADPEVSYYNWGYVYGALDSILRLAKAGGPTVADAVVRLISAAWDEDATPEELRLVEAWLAAEAAEEAGRLDLAEAARSEVERLVGSARTAPRPR